MNPVCANCSLEMKIYKTGARVEEFMDGIRPYRLWNADVFGCPNCGAKIITQFAKSPIAEHYQPEYAEARKTAKYIAYPGLKDLPKPDVVALEIAEVRAR